MLGNLNLENKDIVMTVAVILGPILAVQAQKFVESFKEKRQRRLMIFKTLMSTRAERLNREHVQALNMIDIEFYGRMIPLLRTRYQTKNEQLVTHAWKNYNNHLFQQSNYESLDPWSKKSDELFVKLLYAMSQALSYDFDMVQIQRDCYRPKGHGDLERSQLNILAGLEDIVNGNRPLPMFLTNFQATPQAINNAEHEKQ